MVESRLIRTALLLVLALLSRGMPEEEALRELSERAASDSLNTLSTAEADFRACDRDWNHVNDSWGGVGFLYTMTSVAPSLPSVPPKYWMGTGEYKGILWMFYRMNSGPLQQAHDDRSK